MNSVSRFAWLSVVSRISAPTPASAWKTSGSVFVAAAEESTSVSFSAVSTSTPLIFLAEVFRGEHSVQRVAHLASIKAPTLITWGRDDRVTPMDIALLPMRIMPNAELHVFPNCGHWVMIERKAEFESAVTAFLLRQDG